VTTAELAARVGVTPAAMREMLEESQAAGIVEPSPSGWRITPRAEREYGPALRALDLPGVPDESRPARHAGIRSFGTAA
jgi:DNA-binding IclR family transcriptional regulator